MTPDNLIAHITEYDLEQPRHDSVFAQLAGFMKVFDDRDWKDTPYMSADLRKHRHVLTL